jgi:hypothetical protein
MSATTVTYTRANLANPCGCYHETATVTAISSHTSSEYAYSLSVSVGVMGLSYVAHRLGYHRIERLLPMLDIVYDGNVVIHNYALQPLATSPVASSHLPNRVAK